MGNETHIRQSLNAQEAPFPQELGKTYSASLKGFHFFPPDKTILFRDGDRKTHVSIDSFTKYATGNTTVNYKRADTTINEQETCMEFNWIIKLRDDSGVLEARLASQPTHTFEKEKDPFYRDFPVGIPIELWRYPRTGEDARAIALAKVTIKELTVGRGKSTGIYDVLKMFSLQEREMMNKNFL